MSKQMIIQAINTEIKELNAVENMIGEQSFFGNIVTIDDYAKAVAKTADRLHRYGEMLQA
jgi:hypothetical protein